MPDVPLILDGLDCALVAAGGVILLVQAGRWRRRGPRDPLHSAPLRPNRLSPMMVWLCFLAHLGGWAIGAQIGGPLAPAELKTEVLTAWQSLVAANSAQVLVAATCLAVAWPAFRTGWRGLGLGRQPLASDLAWAGAGVLAAICVCNLLVVGTVALFEWLMPWFTCPDHGVFQMLQSPAATPAMRALAIGGALILAPIGEELFFRGIIQTGIKKLVPRRWGSLRHRWIAIALTALLFALMHVATPHHVAALAALGVILGYLYERRGSLVVPILVHVMFNGKSLLWHQIKEWYLLSRDLAA